MYRCASKNEVFVQHRADKEKKTIVEPRYALVTDMLIWHSHDLGIYPAPSAVRTRMNVRMRFLRVCEQVFRPLEIRIESANVAISS